jgi:hypothetical protein
VTAATDGRAGVRNLANRCVRWRVGRRWYLIAMLGMPIAMTLATTAIFGAPLLNNLFNLVFETFVLIFARVVIIWLYNSTSRSLLIAGLFHAVFNTTNNTFGQEFIPVGRRRSGVLHRGGCRHDRRHRHLREDERTVLLLRRHEGSISTRPNGNGSRSRTWLSTGSQPLVSWHDAKGSARELTRLCQPADRLHGLAVRVDTPPRACVAWWS